MFLFLLFWGDLLLYVFHGFDVISVPVCSELISLYRRWDVSNIIKLSFILFYIISRNENRHHWSSILSHSEDLISPWILQEISLSALFCPFCFVLVFLFLFCFCLLFLYSRCFFSIFLSLCFIFCFFFCIFFLYDRYFFKSISPLSSKIFSETLSSSCYKNVISLFYWKRI